MSGIIGHLLALALQFAFIHILRPIGKAGLPAVKTVTQTAKQALLNFLRFILRWCLSISANMMLSVPLLSKGLQWGEPLKVHYAMFQIEKYWWDERLGACGSPDGPAYSSISSILASMVMARLDFMIRFLCSLVYGAYMIPHSSEAPATMPVLLSLVGYMDAQDAQGTIPEGTMDRLNANPEQFIKLMVEFAWLTYEEPVVSQHILQSQFHGCTVINLQFVSITYEQDGRGAREVPLDTQCLIVGHAGVVVVAFRGSQPVNFLDWAYNSQVDQLPLSHSQRERLNDASTFLKLQQGQQGHVHAGFARTLGLSLRLDGSAIEPVDTVFLETSTLVNGVPNGGLLHSRQTDPGFNSPYTIIRQRAMRLLGGDGHLFVTGHSMGGALAVLFATILHNAPPHGWQNQNIKVATFGQPRVGDQQFVNNMPPDCIRVVNHNDLVPRVPQFFMDTGAPFKHAPRQLYMLTKVGRLEGPIAEPLYDTDFSFIAPAAWHKLCRAWQLLQAAASSRPVPRRGTPQYQSSFRLLVRALLTPMGVINDHIDYKLLLQHSGSHGYWAD